MRPTTHLAAEIAPVLLAVASFVISIAVMYWHLTAYERGGFPHELGAQSLAITSLLLAAISVSLAIRNRRFMLTCIVFAICDVLVCLVTPALFGAVSGS